MKKKNPFTRLSDNQEYLIECVCMFDRSKDIKHKVIKETKYYYILENGDKISKVKGRWLSNVNNESSKAKETLKMEDFKKSMEGIYTTSVSTSTIDESPQAYKSAEDILENIKDICEVVSIIKPVWNVKAGEE